jgi:hypothetical protein
MRVLGTDHHLDSNLKAKPVHFDLKYCNQQADTLFQTNLKLALNKDTNRAKVVDSS